VGERLFNGDVGELGERSLAKRAAGGGEDDAADFWEDSVARGSCVVTRARKRESSLRRLRSERRIIFAVQSGGPAGGAEALVDGVVLGVDGEEFAAGFCGGGHNEFAGGDEDFFV
jgi:hypothetical protein